MFGVFYFVNEETHYKTDYSEQLAVILPDQSKVQLNSNSQIDFKSKEWEKNREVMLNGEAFFDVQHNGKPFLVNTQETNIRVLGTSFNVWAYSDESYTATTLVEGSIILSTAKMEKVLVPNEQASIFLTETDIRVKDVNTDLYTSWMEGKIEFEAENLEAVMRRLARL